MREVDSGIKLTVETRFPDGEVQRIHIASNIWDADGEQMGEFFRQLMAAMGFAEETIKSVFNEDEELFSEMDEDVAGKMDSSDESDMDVCLRNDPCWDCTEPCEDTACLHEEPFDEV